MREEPTFIGSVVVLACYEGVRLSRIELHVPRHASPANVKTARRFLEASVPDVCGMHDQRYAYNGSIHITRWDIVYPGQEVPANDKARSLVA